MITNKVLPKKAITNKVTGNELNVNKLITKNGLENKVTTNKVFTNKVITSKVITNKLLTNKELANKVLKNKVLTNKVLTNKVLTNKVLTNNMPTKSVLTNNLTTKKASLKKITTISSGNKTQCYHQGWKQTESRNNMYDVLNEINSTTDETTSNEENHLEPKGTLKGKGTQQGNKSSKKVRFKKKKKIKLKGKNNIEKIKILYTNANGVADKMNSLQTAAQLYGAHIIAITETKQIPPKIDGYGNWKSKERKNKGGGGVAITARNDIYSKISEIVDLEDDDMDVVWVELRKSQKEKVYIGTYYGKQENEKREVVEKEYELLNSQINMLKNKGEIILTGDFNSKININQKKYQQKESGNGKFLQKLIDSNKLDPVTTRPDVVRWTRQHRNNPEEKSIIDYVLLSSKISHNVEEIIVDEEGLYRIKGRKETDHNTILIEVNLKVIKERKKITKWRGGSNENWRKYNKLLKEHTQAKIPQNQEELQEIIKKSLKQTVGQVTISLNGSKPKESEK